MTTLEARDLAYRRDGQQILSGVSVAVHPGERLAVTGPSGSGKTSLLTLLAGLDTPSSGEVFIDGTRLTGVAGPGQGVAVVLDAPGVDQLLHQGEPGGSRFGLHGSRRRASLPSGRTREGA